MSRTSIAIAAFALVLSACATVRTEPSNEKFNDVPAAARIKPIHEIKPGGFISLKIQDISPSISTDKYSGKFESVQIEGVKGQAFNLQVASICDCVGFKKLSVSPIAQLLDGQGNPIAVAETVDPKTRLLKGTFPADGSYRLLIIADDKATGTKLGDIRATAVITMTETAHPTGTVQVVWTKPK